MRRALQALIAQPGGWTVDDLRTKPPPPFGLMHVCGVLLIFAVPFSMYGVGYGLRFSILWLTPFLLVLMTAIFRRWFFEDVPPNSACIWPRNARRDSVRQYQHTLITVSMVWVVLTVVFLLCVEFMRFGLGDQWNPLAREIRITKGGPFGGYGIVNWAVCVSGFFAITGLVWWPMYAFFEWLSVEQRAGQDQRATHA